ncbi:MAG TPA: BrxA/BrxB family bacilliredoxin [Symbiobacteriaceae bacterium]|nr:BrxA/BrxB family bacilliredoxin [Symbiobacteriaceae bacterium]
MELDMWKPMIDGMRRELTSIGFQELSTAEAVDAALTTAPGTAVVFVNSMCGCAGGIARPGMALALQQGARPDHLFTVFAGQDKEATAQARTYFAPYPPSSPSIAVLRDGKIVTMVERSQIEGSSPGAVAAKVAEALAGAKGA